MTDQSKPTTDIPDVETDINKRWENGTPHHPKSVALFKSLSDIDFKHGGDYFCWKSGGDGDNGEHLMYELDIHFERADLIPETKTAQPVSVPETDKVFDPTEEVIDGMCMTYRHDFFLDKCPAGISSGITEEERDGLRSTMRQIWEHNIKPHIRAALQQDDSELVRALTKCRDRFFPEDQPEQDRDIDWDLVNEALAKHRNES